MDARKNRTREEDTRWKVAPRAPFVLAYYYQTLLGKLSVTPLPPPHWGINKEAVIKCFMKL